MDRFFLDALLHPQFVVEKVVGDASGAAVVVDTVNANAIAVAISANHTYLQIAVGCLPDASCSFFHRHFGLDEKRLGSECGKTDNAAALFRVYWLSLTAVKTALPKLRSRAMIQRCVLGLWYLFFLLQQCSSRSYGNGVRRRGACGSK
jgi:hypothetical protein